MDSVYLDLATDDEIIAELKKRNRLFLLVMVKEMPTKEESENRESMVLRHSNDAIAAAGLASFAHNALMRNLLPSEE